MLKNVLTLLASKGLSLRCTTAPGCVFLVLQATEGKPNFTQNTPNYLHFNGFIPVDDISTQDETFNMHYVDVSSLSPDVKPLRLQGQVHVCDSGVKVLLLKIMRSL